MRKLSVYQIFVLKPNEHTQAIIEQHGGSRLKDGILAIDLRRPEMTYDIILEI